MDYLIIYVVLALFATLLLFLLLFLIYYLYTNRKGKKIVNETNQKKETTMFLKYYLKNSDIIVNNVDNIDWNFGKIIGLIKNNETFQKNIKEYVKQKQGDDFTINLFEKKVYKNLTFSFKKYCDEEQCIILKCVYKRDFKEEVEIELPSLEEFKKEHEKFKKRHGVMFYINVLEFNLINQRYGRLSGDYVLSIFKSRLKEFENRNVYPLYLSKDHFALFVNKKVREKKIMKIAKSISQSLKKTIDIGGLGIELSVEIGVCKGKHENIDSYIHYSYIACEHCKKTNQQVVLYNDNLKSEEMLAKYAKEEIDIILDKNKTELLYNAMYSFNKNKIIGYFSKVDLKNDNINFEKIRAYADQTGLYNQLMSINFKSKLTNFMKNRPFKRSKLLIDMKLEDLVLFREIFLSDSSFSGCKTIICLDIRKGFDIVYRSPEILDELMKIINERIEVALIINENLFYDYDVFLKNADYIIINGDLVKNINENIINKNKVKSIIKKSKEYDLEFIARDISEYLELETLLKLDIKYMSGTYFSVWNNLPSEIEYSKTKRLTYLLNENFYK